MHQVSPKVHMIAQTQIDPMQVVDMLCEVGMTQQASADWVNTNYDPSTQGGEFLVEVAGRLCYKSFEPGLNKNVTKVREGNQQYLANILSSKHGSVLEHATVSFAFIGVSRVFTHEIVRHRAGCAFSQESLRYVRLDDLGMRLPYMFEDDDFLNKIYEAQPIEWRVVVDRKQFVSNKKRDVKAAFDKTFTASEEAYTFLCNAFEIDNIKDFNLKKKLTSAFRRIAPIGLTTNILVTANHRAWRHIVELRSSRYAEEEVVEVIGKVGTILKETFPNIYQDMERNEHGEWVFANSKI